MDYQVQRWESIFFVTELAPDLPKILCDRNQIAQVIINLLNNAHDAMPEGGTLTLRTRRAPGGAALEVIDTGEGIAPEIADKLFDPFFTTKPIGQGSGLGLAIVSGIVRAHNGTLTVHSDGPGHGASFTVTLPAA
jgi:two-component system NtrC family sensor kinase